MIHRMILRDLDVLEVGGRTSARIAGELLARLGATVRRVDLGRSEAGLGGLGEHPVIGDRDEVMALAWDRGKTVQVARPARRSSRRCWPAPTCC